MLSDSVEFIGAIQINLSISVLLSGAGRQPRAAYQLLIDETDSQTDGRTDTSPTHRSSPPEAGSVNNIAQQDAAYCCKCSVVGVSVYVSGGHDGELR